VRSLKGRIVTADAMSCQRKIAQWGIENGLHWVLDVVMDEDQARNRKDHGPQNLALLRKLALNLAKRFHAWKAQAGRLGQHLPPPNPAPVRKCSNAIALIKSRMPRCL
jgi:hypothetical protein